MSKDIWHFPSEAPVYCFQCVFYDRASNEYHFGQYSPVFKHFRSGNAGWEHEEVQRFAFAKDIIASLDELDRTRKALDTAKKWLMEIGYLNMEEHGIGSEKMMTNWCKTVALHGLKEIETALEQKDVK